MEGKRQESGCKLVGNEVCAARAPTLDVAAAANSCPADVQDLYAFRMTAAQPLMALSWMGAEEEGWMDGRSEGLRVCEANEMRCCHPSSCPCKALRHTATRLGYHGVLL